MRSMRSAQRQVELRRLDNQLPVLVKANSLCKIVKCCVFCLFVRLRRSPGRRGRSRYPGCARIPGGERSRVIVAREKFVQRLDDVLQYQLRPLAVGTNYQLPLSTFFRLLCAAFSFADVDTDAFLSYLAECLPRKSSW